MPPPSLYVCKAARRPRYRHENLHLLAAERGRVVEASYNPMWVAPELLDDGAIPRGAPVYFLLTDRPYTHFAPVRQGEVLEVERDDIVFERFFDDREDEGWKSAVNAARRYCAVH